MNPAAHIPWLPRDEQVKFLRYARRKQRHARKVARRNRIRAATFRAGFQHDDWQEGGAL